MKLKKILNCQIASKFDLNNLFCFHSHLKSEESSDFNFKNFSFSSELKKKMPDYINKYFCSFSFSMPVK